jgi:hypothetical protein
MYMRPGCVEDLKDGGFGLYIDPAPTYLYWYPVPCCLDGDLSLSLDTVMYTIQGVLCVKHSNTRQKQQQF